jgi:hypothetical protein
LGHGCAACDEENGYTMTFFMDPSDKNYFDQLFKLKSTPTTLVVEKTGTVLAKIVGMAEYDNPAAFPTCEPIRGCAPRGRDEGQALFRQGPGAVVAGVHLVHEIKLQIVPVARFDHFLLFTEVVEDVRRMGALLLHLGVTALVLGRDVRDVVEGRLRIAGVVCRPWPSACGQPVSSASIGRAS